MSKEREKQPDPGDEDRRALGERLRQAREYLGFSQDQVATDPRSPAVGVVADGDRAAQGGGAGAEEAGGPLQASGRLLHRRGRRKNRSAPTSSTWPARWRNSRRTTARRWTSSRSSCEPGRRAKGGEPWPDATRSCKRSTKPTGSTPSTTRRARPRRRGPGRCVPHALRPGHLRDVPAAQEPARGVLQRPRHGRPGDHETAAPGAEVHGRARTRPRRARPRGQPRRLGDSGAADLRLGRERRPARGPGQRLRGPTADAAVADRPSHEAAGVAAGQLHRPRHRLPARSADGVQLLRDLLRPGRVRRHRPVRRGTSSCR